MVYLAGLGRGGSTLLERLLGEIPGACPAGEVVHLWLRGVGDGERCGCGQPFPACPFWQAVGQDAFGGWTGRRGPDDPAAGPGGPGPVPAAARLGSPPRRLRPELDEYVAYYRRIYAAIAEVSGSPVVIDSSKHASLAFCLRGSSGLDLRVVHVVRDPRAVAYSWSKIVARPDAAAGNRMSTYPRPAPPCGGTCRMAPCSCWLSSAPRGYGSGTRTS